MTKIKAPNVTGCHVGWGANCTIQRADLAEAWEREGLDEKHLPPRTATPASALAKTGDELRSQKERIYPRPLPKKGSPGFVLVQETVDGSEIDWEELLRVEFDNDLGTAIVTPHNHSMAQTVRDLFYKYLDMLTASDITTWLGSFAREVGGIHMIPRGAWYFLPREYEDTWLAMVRAISSVGSVAFTFSRAYSDDAEGVASIISHLKMEADRMMADTEAILYPEEEPEKAPGERLLRNQAGRCEKMCAKVAAWEKLLQQSLPEVTDRLDELNANLVRAALAVENGADFRQLGLEEQLGAAAPMHT
jgi:hypothetical protein